MALALLAIVVVVHRRAVDAAGIVFADVGSGGAMGVGGVLADLGAATALASLPIAIVAVPIVLGLAGWSAWRDPLASRLLAVVIALLAWSAASAVGTGTGTVLLAAPLSLAGLLFLPDGLRDLGRAALDRRRIVVRRVAR